MEVAIDVFLGVLLLCCFMCIFRIGRGPTAPDRTVAIDILGIIVVGFHIRVIVKDGCGAATIGIVFVAGQMSVGVFRLLQFAVESIAIDGCPAQGIRDLGIAAGRIIPKAAISPPSIAKAKRRTMCMTS